MSATDTIFSQIADQYDRNNLILSMGICKWWTRKLIQATRTSGVLLDLCAGTGEIAYHSKAKRVILLDSCQEMLDRAKRRSRKKGNFSYLLGDAQDIPLDNSCVDAITTAYGIRNVADPLQCGREVYRVLKPGGVWGILELTRPNAPLRYLHQFYLKTVVPLVGGLLSSSKEAYQYLSESVQTFVSPSELGSQLLQVGFQELLIQPLTGGIATLIILKK